jgi:hypothetical protein
LASLSHNGKMGALAKAYAEPIQTNCLICNSLAIVGRAVETTIPEVLVASI